MCSLQCVRSSVFPDEVATRIKRFYGRIYAILASISDRSWTWDGLRRPWDVTLDLQIP